MVTATTTTALSEEPSGAVEPPAKKQAVAMAVPATVSQEDQKVPVETVAAAATGSAVDTATAAATLEGLL